MLFCLVVIKSIITLTIHSITCKQGCIWGIIWMKYIKVTKRRNIIQFWKNYIVHFFRAYEASHPLQKSCFFSPLFYNFLLGRKTKNRSAACSFFALAYLNLLLDIYFFLKVFFSTGGIFNKKISGGV